MRRELKLPRHSVQDGDVFQLQGHWWTWVKFLRSDNTIDHQYRWLVRLDDGGIAGRSDGGGHPAPPRVEAAPDTP